MFLRIRNEHNFCNIKLLIVFIFTVLITTICGLIKYVSNSFTSIIFLIFSLSLLYSIITKTKIGYSILNTIISLSINYILFFITVVIYFIPSIIFNISNHYINLFAIVCIYIILVCIFFKIKRFKNGFSFLNKTSIMNTSIY